MTTEYRLRVELRGGDIVVTCPGSSYRVVYYKPADQPQLMAKEKCGNTSHVASLTQAEFHARAWKLANDRARQLGCIV